MCEGELMKKTAYFERRRQQRGIRMEEVEEALDNEIERQVQDDGRTRIWGYVETRDLCFRIVLTRDGKLLNVFPDSNFTRTWKRRHP